MYPNFPHIYEGEIVQAMPQEGTSRPFQTYLVRIERPDGTQMLIPNARSLSMFGGIADYIQLRSRATMDDGSDFSLTTQEAENARIGDRVYVAFIGGAVHKPIIIGYAQHPNQVIEFADEDAASLKPQAVFQYLGVRMLVDDKGQLTLIHKGAPEIKDTAAGGALGAAAAAVGSLLGAAGANNPALGAGSDAVTPADEAGITLMEFLDEGVFRIRDSDGQMIEMDRTKGRIYISNNDLKSTEDPANGPASGGNQLASNSTDAEYVLLDRNKELVLINARKTAQIYSFDKRKDVTDGSHSHKVGEDNTWTVGGDETITIDGSKTDKISGDWTADITGKWTFTAKGDVALTSAAGNVKITDGGQAFIKFEGGKIEFGNAAGKALDTVSKGLDKASQIATQAAAIIVPTAVGPSGPPTNAASFTQLAADLLALKVIIDSIKA